MPQLNVALVPAPDQVVVRLVGDADLASVPLLSDALRQAAGLGTAQVVVDVATVRFWDASCLSTLAEFTAELAASGRACRLTGALAGTRRLITVAALGDRLELDGSVRPVVMGAPDEPNVVAELPDPRPSVRVTVPGDPRKAHHLRQ